MRPKRYTRLIVKCLPDFTEILSALITDAGFETILETADGFEAYVEEEGYDLEKIRDLESAYRESAQASFHFDEVEDQNWNAVWEKNYSPVVIEERCLIRADFHPSDSRYPYEIIITPKMSFGTGHHPTTYLMLKTQMQLDHSGRNVIDAGCGTGILSIMASKLGAARVDAFDVDSWCISNAEENFAVNSCENVCLRQGAIRDMTFEEPADILLANINRNILLEEMGAYRECVKTGALVLLSGFFEADILPLIHEANRNSFKADRQDIRASWACLVLRAV